MNKIEKIVLFSSWFLFVVTDYANAGLKEIVDNPALVIVFNILLLLFMLAGWFLCSKIRSFLKGGELILGWFLILISFIFVFASQFLEFGIYIKLWEISPTVVYFARLLWIMVLVLGIYFIQIWKRN